MSFDLLREIRAEFTRLRWWSEHNKQVFLVYMFLVDSEVLLLLDERQYLLSVLKTLKPFVR